LHVLHGTRISRISIGFTGDRFLPERDPRPVANEIRLIRVP
jgi:hypothetical protein